MPDVAIEAHDLRKSFKDVHALDGIDLEVPRGTVLGLLGPNGAGKTTAVRILTTLLKPDAGSARVAGLDVVRDASALRSQIGLAGQYAAVDENLTGHENLEMVGRLYHMGRRAADERASELLERFSLTDAADRLAKTYSGGMRRRLDLAAALVVRPPVIFLDEPTTGLDPRSRLQLWETIEARVAAGTTVLLTTQYLDEADRLADSIAVIDQGQVIAEGTSDQLKDRVGGERLEVTLCDGASTEAAIEALVPLAEDRPKCEAGVLALPLSRGRGGIAEAVRRLDDAGVGIDDIAVHRPTLDDVFITLTGHAAEPDEEEPEARRGRARGACGMSALAYAVADTAVIAKRNLLRIPRQPDLWVSFTIQPVMFVLLFVYVFGGAIQTPGYDYVDFLMPGIVIQTMAFGGFVTAIGLSDDLRKGLIDRFRSLPMARSAVLGGRTLADVATNAISIAVMVGVGLIVGFSFSSSPIEVIAGFALCILFGYAFSWIFAFVALSTSSAEGAQALGFMLIFPLTFASSAFVPPESMPSWLEAFAEANPFSTVVDALRALWVDAPHNNDVWAAVAWCIGLIVVFAGLAVYRYRRAVSA